MTSAIAWWFCAVVDEQVDGRQTLAVGMTRLGQQAARPLVVGGDAAAGQDVAGGAGRREGVGGLLAAARHVP